MSLNIIDLIKGQLGPAVVSQAATQLGESESGVSKAISGLLPAVVGGLANNADNPAILDAVTNAGSSGILSNLLGGSANNSLISTVISAIFGDKVGGLVNAVSNFSGLGSGSTNSLLNLVTGAALGSVGKYASDNNLGAGGVSSLLGDQKGIISTLLPAGLSLASLGLNWSNDKAQVAEKVSNVKADINTGASQVREDIRQTSANVRRDVEDNNGGGGSIWKWLLPLLLVLLAGWFLWKQCQKKEAAGTTGTNDSAAINQDSASTTNPSDSATATVPATTVTKVDEDIDLNGTKLKGYKGGLEDQMITFLKTDGYKNAANDEALKTKWYDFDHVNFKMGSSTELEAGSEGQLNNLLQILKAFPDAKVKIGGYTDKTGNEANNVKLSKARAEFIKKWLTDKGVGAQVLAADGYGSQFATVAADKSDAERAVDRKMAVRFAK